MNLLDIVIILVVIGSAALGARAGFAVQVGRTVGLVVGVLFGALISSQVVHVTTDPTWRAALVAVTLAVSVTVLATAGSRLGEWVAEKLGRFHLRRVDQVLGAFASACGALFATWLLAASLAYVPQAGVGPLIQDSAIVQRLDSLLPPVPEVTARLGRLLDPLGVPRVFVGLEPPPAAPVDSPTSEQVQAAARAAIPSMVRVAGAGCGGLLVGSGFIVGPGLVMTNAHVIAGISAPKVEQGSKTFKAVPVLFDSRVDLAILRVAGLSGPALPLDSQLPDRGAVGATLGYPNGGALTITSAAVLASYDATGRDIYDQSIVTRPVIELQSAIRPGDSGGPFVLTDGHVAGVVFARSVTNSQVGYAVGSTAAATALAAASAASQPVTTGACAAG